MAKITIGLGIALIVLGVGGRLSEDRLGPLEVDAVVAAEAVS